MMMVMMMKMMLNYFCFLFVDHLRVTCYPETRVSHVTLGRACHSKRRCTAKQSKGQAKQVWRVWEGVFWRGGVFFLGAGGGSNNAADLSRECRQRTRQNFRTRTGYATLCCVGLASFIRCRAFIDADAGVRLCHAVLINAQLGLVGRICDAISNSRFPASAG